MVGSGGSRQDVATRGTRAALHQPELDQPGHGPLDRGFRPGHVGALEQAGYLSLGERQYGPGHDGEAIALGRLEAARHDPPGAVGRSPG